MDELRHRQLGDSGISVPVVGIGCNNFGRRLDAAATARVVNAAIDNGITFFDTADIYGEGKSEEYLGRALAGRRDSVIIATKFGGEMGNPRAGGGSRRWIEDAVEGSLRRLGTDHIDLYQHHFPDAATPLAETLAALNDLVTAGKVRAIGSSNYSGEQIEVADRIARERGWAHCVTAQNHYSLLERAEVERDVAPVCTRLDIGLLPYFPLASGMLTGKYRRGQQPPEGTRLAGDRGRADELMSAANFEVVEGLEAFAHTRGLQLIDVTVGALAALPAVVSVIAGATRPEQVAANAHAGGWIPTPAEIAEIDAITRRQPVG
jgi:aryl-alcohol dehydrogenase-like predicted oxidoreductase